MTQAVAKYRFASKTKKFKPPIPQYSRLGKNHIFFGFFFFLLLLVVVVGCCCWLLVVGCWLLVVGVVVVVVVVVAAAAAAFNFCNTLLDNTFLSFHNADFP